MEIEELAVLLIIFCFVVVILSIVGMISKRKQLRRYNQINIGMSEKEMLKIMGGGYNKSSLKNGRKKFEWRINATSYSSKGFRSYSGVSKVEIYTRNGRVEEIKPYNVR